MFHLIKEKKLSKFISIFLGKKFNWNFYNKIEFSVTFFALLTYKKNYLFKVYPQGWFQNVDALFCI